MAKKHTGFEKLAITINNQQKRIGEREQDRIFRSVYKAGPISRTYYGRLIHYCSECGCHINYIGQKECPQCHAKWTWQGAEPQKQERIERGYHMELVARGEYQLCRIYRVERITQYGKAVRKFVWEVERIVYAPTGERRVFARRVQTMAYCYDAFSIWSPIELKRDDEGASENAKLRHNLSVWSYHIKSLSPQWQHKDIDTMMCYFDNDTSVLRVIAYPWGEQLWKTGQQKLFRYLVHNIQLLPKNVVHTINICHRNHYTINDPSIWLDHIALLRRFGLDTHNAHYVCPKDLTAMHNELTERRRRQRVREEAEKRARNYGRRLAGMDKEKKAYLKRWGAMLTLQLQADNLSVRPLQSVDEFAAEGAAMHHCVFENNYFNRDHSLILSAKDGEGNRLATIEYNTHRMQIIQCRAACNAIPERDSEIRGLIESHRKDIVKLLKAA